MKKAEASRDYDVIVIGAGPAGLMAGRTAAAQGCRTLIIDKNKKAGRKLRITGKGRCNVTNNCEAETVIAAMAGNGKFLYGALRRFSPADTMSYFEGLGVPLKTERGRRVFPYSDDANDIADAMAGDAAACGAVIRQGKVQRLLVDNMTITGVETETQQLHARRVILACGGASYPGTGSTGDILRFAKQTGHRVTPLRPSLVPLVEAGNTCRELQGLSLKNIALRVVDERTKKQIYDEFGELLFTHFGLSGPVVLSASAHMRDVQPGRYRVEIDLKPARSLEQLETRLLREFQESPNRQLANILSGMLPQRMISVMLARCGLPGDLRCHSITKGQRRQLMAVLKCFVVKIAGTRPLAEAIVTAGGVALPEIDPKTMASKRIQGLSFAGECMDLDAYTGGYNLQIAFSTGYAAGLG